MKNNEFITELKKEFSGSCCCMCMEKLHIPFVA